MQEKLIGKVSHYFDKISVVAIKLEAELKAGDEVHFLGHGVDFTQVISSMQMNNEEITSAVAGDEIGTKVDEKVKSETEVFLVEQE
ncbi:MAG: translation elongation factor-like protein [Patescibacteria group bacterium]